MVSRWQVCTTLGAAAVLATAVAPAEPATTGAEPARLARVVDGDTVVLRDGRRVRLLQIDTPEPGSGECYSRAAGRELRRLLPEGTALGLETDPALGRSDRYGRALRYVWRGRLNVNLELVRRGAATVWLYGGVRGRYAAELLQAARSARAARRGLWGACPAAVWDPLSAATTGSSSGAASAGSGVARTGCDPSYPDVCLAPPPPDLDCRDVPRRAIRVLPPDPHRLDGDGDGIGCETKRALPTASRAGRCRTRRPTLGRVLPPDPKRLDGDGIGCETSRAAPTATGGPLPDASPGPGPRVPALGCRRSCRRGTGSATRRRLGRPPRRASTQGAGRRAEGDRARLPAPRGPCPSAC